MNFLDIVILVLLLFGIIQGLWKGFFVEIASLLSLILGVFIAIKFSGYTADWIRENYLKESEHLEIIAFAVTFLAVLIAVILLGKVFTRLADFSGLGWVNRLLGAFFGLLKMAFILSILLHYFSKFNTNNILVPEERLSESKLYHPMLKVSDTLFPVLTDWFHQVKGEKENLSDKQE